MKKLLLPSAFLSLFLCSAQEKETPDFYLKANALFLPVGMLNAGIEYQIAPQYTVQADLFVSPWKSFLGHYAQMYMLGADGRYYFDEAFSKWYVGANVTATRFIMQKWNYWNDMPYQFTENSPVYNTRDLYQDGFSFLVGAVGGYQHQINERLNLDFYLGIGYNASFYQGFHKHLNIRYDEETTRKWNRSGEWIPYRGGLMISYKLFK